MSWLSSFLNPQRGYQEGQGQLDKYYQQGQGFQQPYLDALSDPQALQDKWSKGYNESEAAKQAQTMGQEHGLNAANSMGLMGSNTALNAIQSGASQIGQEYKQNYLDDLMKKYMAGAGMATNMAQGANQMGENSAQMKFGETNSPGNMFSKLLEGLVSFGTPFAQNYGMQKMGLSQPGSWNTTGGR